MRGEASRPPPAPAAPSRPGPPSAPAARPSAPSPSAPGSRPAVAGCGIRPPLRGEETSGPPAWKGKRDGEGSGRVLTVVRRGTAVHELHQFLRRRLRRRLRALSRRLRAPPSPHSEGKTPPRAGTPAGGGTPVPGGTDPTPSRARRPPGTCMAATASRRPADRPLLARRNAQPAPRTLRPAICTQPFTPQSLPRNPRSAIPTP